MLGECSKNYLKWEAVRKRNAWVNIYNPGRKFDSFLKRSNKRDDKVNEKTRRYLVS